MNKLRLVIISFFLLCLSTFVVGQEEYVDFIPQIQNRLSLKSITTPYFNTNQNTLPFFDDFAYPTNLPLPQNWCDSNVIVGNGFGKNTITIGTATLDALNNKGLLYENASVNSVISDYLTSQPINLHSYEKVYESDKLYHKLISYVLLSDTYYMYESDANAFMPVTMGLKYVAGDTLYQKQGLNYVPIQDSLFESNSISSYIEGSYTYEHKSVNYTLEDSLALSFYFQSGGNGDLPEATDSLVLEYYAPYAREGIFINEFSRDWIELYNASDSVKSLTDWFLVVDTIAKVLANNTLSDYKITSIQNITIAPYSHKIIYVKDFGKTDFLNATIYLLSPDSLVVDSVENGDQIPENGSFARIPDGNPIWSFTAISSPSQCNSDWKEIWSSSKNTGDYFEYVFLPFTSLKYFQKGFRFRFKNYTSLSNDVSHARNEDFWNIDMVWLDAHRTVAKQNYADVAFVDNISPLYNAYTSLPKTHFQKVNVTDFKMNVDSKFTNFDEVYRKVKFNFAVQKRHSNESLSFSTYETDIPPFTLAEERDILTDWNVDFFDFMNANLNSYEKGLFEFQYYFTDNNNFMYSQFRWNDTSRVNLKLSNYYAYDDGMPEAGYGLREAPMGRVAFKYNTLMADTLKAIDIYFNPTLNETAPIFNLCVWAVNADGKPGDLLYYMPGEKVSFDDGIYNFVTYKIKQDGILTGDENGVFISNGFFVGWEQPYDVLLNVGLDVTSTLKNKIFYNLGYEWVNSSQVGALMMRPVFGNINSDQTPINSIDSTSVYLFPTIAKDEITIANSDDEYVVAYSIIDLSGRKIEQTNNQNNLIPVSNLPNGFYTIECHLNTGRVFNTKCIIQK
jgi:hypothetical protein